MTQVRKVQVRKVQARAEIRELGKAQKRDIQAWHKKERLRTKQTRFTGLEDWPKER